MFVLDTNVVSELMRAAPSTAVLAWMDERPATSLFITAVTEAEVRTGVALLPRGARRQALADAAEQTLDGLFGGRVFPFDSRAARSFAQIFSARRAVGRPIAHADCQIAAIAGSRDMAVATRNVRDFADTGVETIDPWNFE